MNGHSTPSTMSEAIKLRDTTLTSTRVQLPLLSESHIAVKSTDDSLCLSTLLVQTFSLCRLVALETLFFFLEQE